MGDECLQIANDACFCVRQLALQGAVAQRYMRESGHLTAVTRTLRMVFHVLSARPAELAGVATVLLQTVGVFVSTSADSAEAAGNAAAVLRDGVLADLVCGDLLQVDNPDPTVLMKALRSLKEVVSAAEGTGLLPLIPSPVAGNDTPRPFDTFISVLLCPSRPFHLQELLGDLIADVLSRNAFVRERLAGELKLAMAAAGDIVGEVSESVRDMEPYLPGSAAARLLVRAAREPCLKDDGALITSSWHTFQIIRLSFLGGQQSIDGSVYTTHGDMFSIIFGVFPRVISLWAHGDSASRNRTLETSLMSLLHLLSEWCSRDASVARSVSSPAVLQELFAAVKQTPSSDWMTVAIRGVSALVLTNALLQLPAVRSSGDDRSALTAPQLMDALASRVGLNVFTQATDDFERGLADPTMKTAAGDPTTSLRSDAPFCENCKAQFQAVREKLVQLWLTQDVASSIPESDTTIASRSGGTSMAGDVAGHFRDLIRMQDRELQDLREKVNGLEEENARLHTLTTDEDKTLLLWKVEALSKQSKALQEQCDQL